jgi:hypothetical protein
MTWLTLDGVRIEFGLRVALADQPLLTGTVVTVGHLLGYGRAWHVVELDTNSRFVICQSEELVSEPVTSASTRSLLPRNVCARGGDL